MKNPNSRIRLKVYKMLIAIVVAGLVVLGLYGYTRYLASVPNTLRLGTDNDKHRFVHDISKEWSERSHGYKVGEQVDIVVENRSQNTMLDWSMVLDIVPNSHMDSNWNGVYEYDEKNNVITVTCLDYNDTVDPGELQSFGMILYGPGKFIVKDATFVYHIERRLVDIPAFWAILILLAVYLVSAITSMFYEMKTIQLAQKQKEYMSIINQSFVTFANTIDAKDNYTKGHSQRVAWYARELAKRLGCEEDFCQNIFYVGLLHDIGKIGVQDAILKKSARLTYDEFNEIKEHVSMGGDILEKFTAIPGIEDGARYHHERYDGTGYMEGLKGEAIPYLARIITVADSFDAMSSARCYRNAMDKEKIIEELNRCSGTQFDPKIVPHMIDMVNEGVAPIELSDGQLEKEFDL